ncbi:HAD domain-containing protein [Taibaiella chishuiensis]|uniref:NLI interacting factor-like phosphatase n=1 Tax=Taibaiella chishuiensis TaxID=1434707 RepID=A0A2P8DAY6_9BACT|nr:HAD domain-containing protein [Taibaiella chishuiensis]PSK94382.1 hypothetical protein B0I18_101537 [Taibaiella chishuiensis]
MTLLLDIDGVLVTTPSWRPVPQAADGFMAFDKTALHYLSLLLSATQAAIVLTSTHRIRYSEQDWVALLRNRGLDITRFSKINTGNPLQPGLSRLTEIIQWMESPAYDPWFVIIDDDASLHDLPAHGQARWVKTNLMTGLDEAAYLKALSLLQAPV